jgi:peroxiredoxin
MRLKPLVFFTLVGLLAAYAIYHQSLAPDATLIGSPAPEFELADQNGEMVSLSDFSGSLVFLNFWATWCEPCVTEMPDMMKLQEQFKGRPFQILAISLDTNWEDVESFYEDLDLDFVTMLDPGRQLASKYRLLGQPETFLIDGNGIIRRKFLGDPRWMRPQLMAELESLLQEHEAGSLSTTESAGD